MQKTQNSELPLYFVQKELTPHPPPVTPKYFVDTVQGFEACEGKKKKCMAKLMGAMGDYRSVKDNGEVKVTYTRPEVVRGFDIGPPPPRQIKKLC